MSHPQRNNARHVQRVLTEEAGVCVSYNWVLLEVTKHIDKAKEIAKAKNQHVRDVLVDMIRPANRHNEERIAKGGT
jgi:hypothetical protein